MNNQILLPADALPLISLTDTIECEEGFIHPNRIMDVNILLYVEKGSFHIYEEDPNRKSTDSIKEYTLTEGSLLFLKEGFHHFGDVKCPDKTKWFFVHFYLPKVSENSKPIEPFTSFLYPENSLGKDNDVHYVLPKMLTLSDKSSLISRFETLTHMYRSGDLANRLRMNSYFCQILMDIYREGLITRSRSNKELRTEEMLEYLEKHKNEPFSSQGLEDKMHLSFKHLNLIFKSVTGTTLQKHHAHLRMDQAAKMLRETSLSIEEISRSLGFDEQFYFSNSFKKQFGLSPSTYRNNQIII